MSTDTQESEEMRKLKEKAKEFRAMSDLKISKLKEKYLEEINDVKIKKLRVEGELNSVVKERNRLKESERILVETFATLKTFYEKQKESFPCDICDITCSSPTDLQNHKERSHQVRFTCSSCAYTTESNGEYENHLRTHEGSQESTSLVCEVCGKRDLSKQSLEKHIEDIHTCLECKTVWSD